VTEGAPDPERGDAKTILSWALYDLANTIYSAIVVTLFLPSFLEDRYGAAWPLGVTTSVTLLASAFVSPWLGSLVDRTGKARRGLDLFTWGCTLSSAALCWAAWQGLLPALACFAVSLFCYQGALTFYNALLPVVAPPTRRGYVSGLGTGLGYLGIPVAIVIALFVKDTALGIPGTFLVSAVLMTLGTIPLWLNVHDGPALGVPPVRERPPRAAQGVIETLRSLRGHKALLLLLVANLVSADVANTLIQWATYYFEKGEGMTKNASGIMVIALAFTALLGGLTVGRVADRLPPARIYLACCAGLVLGLAGVAAFPGTWPFRILLILTGGIGVAAIWSVGRQLVVRLAPPDRIGACMGLYGVTTKISILGTTLFPVLREVAGFRVAIAAEAAMLALGCVLIEALHRTMERPLAAARAVPDVFA
jgi:UMF1 family MFS transporter